MEFSSAHPPYVQAINTDYLIGRTDAPSPFNPDNSSTRNGGRAYYDGGKDWTEEEIQAADEFIKMLRKRDAERKKREEQ